MTTLAHLRRKVYKAHHILKCHPYTNRILKIQACYESSFVPKRVLILTKVSRYQVEKLMYPDLKEDELRLKLIARGTNYEAILSGHLRNKATEKQTIKTLGELNIKYRVRDRYNIDINSIEWADLILPVGGDGTFLLASNLIPDNTKPIVGINSDPEFSEGFLMLPKKYTNNIFEIFEKLKAGNFKYYMRSRIRITLAGSNIWHKPFHMHEENPSEHERFYEIHYELTKPKGELPKIRQLPWLALNEVFVGAILSAKISVLNINTGNDSFQKIKSSGMCVSTGTGSTSWYKAINSVNVQMVTDLLKLVKKENITNPEAKKICYQFNKSLSFPADDKHFSYAIRDIIVKNTWPLPDVIDSRGFSKKLTVQTQCCDTGLVIDGGIAVHLKMGSTAIFETVEDCALKNIVLLD